MKSGRYNILYGRNPAQEWLDSGLPVRRILLAEDVKGRVVDEIEKQAGKRRINLKRLSRRELSRMLGHGGHQGVAIEVESISSYVEIDDILDVAGDRREAPLVCILDGVQDPHNLGAVLRTAECAGVHGVIIPKDRAAGLTPGVVKASAGAATHVPVARVVNLARAIDSLKEKGLWIVGADQDGEKAYTAIDFNEGVGIVMGGQEKGLRRLVREKCDFLASIPMFGRINSLNVSVAASLFMFEARRQRTLHGQ